MSYLVLARKHRPATFEQVVGQEHITRTLAGAISADRVAHAFMFAGPRGVGKTSVARILAKALNCQEGPTVNPCGQCVHCREIEAGSAIDVQEIDAASNSRVEDVRELREVIRYRPQSARFRVTILDEVHMLSKAAFNALLKTLEEPPEHALFILATTDVHKVPLTILSRCQRYDFRRLPPRLLAQHLAQVLQSEGCQLAPESLALMAREADGSVRDALSLLDQVLSLDQAQMSHQEVVQLLGLMDRELVAATANAVLAGDPAAVLDLVAQLYAAGGEMQAFYGALEEEFRNLAAAKAANQDLDLFGLTEEEVADLRRRAEQVSAETLHEVFDILARSEELFRRASHPRLVLEMTLLRLSQVRPVLSLEEVLARLGQDEPPPDERVKPATAPAAPAAPAPPAPPPPAQAAPPGAQALPPAQEALKELARYAERIKPMLASQLGRGQARLEDGVLCLTLPAGAAENFCTTENQEALGQMARELWPELAGLRLEADQPPEPQPEPKQMENLTGLAEHPAVQEAMDVFEAQVVALNPGRDSQ